MQSNVALSVKQSKSRIQTHDTCLDSTGTGCEVLLSGRGSLVFPILSNKCVKYPSEGIADGKLVEMCCKFRAPEKQRCLRRSINGWGSRGPALNPWTPHSNGLVNRFNCTLITQLSILAKLHQHGWDSHLWI